MRLYDIRKPRPLICAEPLERRVLFDGGDFSLDFVAAAPFTYDHSTGGGAFDDRTIGKTNDVVESLEGGDFACGDIVTYLVEITVDNGATGAQTIELDFEFLSDATGQSGVGHDDIVGVQINYGAIAQADVDGDSNPDVIGDGPGETDSGIDDDGGSVATLVDEDLPSNPFHNGTTNLTGTVEVTDLEAGEAVILRIDVHIDCDDNASPTGNLQASITDARVTEPEEDDISVGNQTVPFKNIDELVVPGINVIKTGPDLSKIGDEVTYAYTVTNNGNVALDNVVVEDDAGTPADTSDDFNPTFDGGDDDSDGLLDTDEAWLYSATLTVPAGASDPFTNTATVTANADGDEQDTTDDQDSHTIELFQPSIDLEKDADVTEAAEGDTITYSYTVENDGSSDSPDLIIDTFVDDNGTPGDNTDDFTPDDVDTDIDTFNDGDTDEDGQIDVGETWLFTATRVVASGDDDPLVNTAVIHTHPEDFPNDITDTDTASVDLFQPAIQVVKDGPDLSKIGDSVTYTYEVTNEGSAGSPALENVVVTDDAGTPGDTSDDFNPNPVDADIDGFNDGDTNQDNKLDIGETWLYEYTLTVPAGASDPFENTVTAEADVVGSVADADDTDTHSINLFQPSIALDKTGPEDALVGDTITYSYTVTNNGSSDSPDLIIDTFVDDNGTPGDTGDDFTPDDVDLDIDGFNDGDTDEDGQIDVGETWLFTATRTLTSNDDDPLVNTAVIHTHPKDFPNDITAEDTHAIDLVRPPHVDGRMTGGGSVFLSSGMIGGPIGTRVTHGFQIHCSPDPKTGRHEDVNNRLEINWSPGKANVHFHLSYLTEVECEDDPQLDPEHPLAPIDTFKGVGVGLFTGTFGGTRYNKAQAYIVFAFTDDGERGTNDTASYLITVGGTTVLRTENAPSLDTDDPGDLFLRFGNHQAHREIPPLLNNDPTLRSMQRKINSTFSALNNVKLTESKVLSLTSQLLSLMDSYNQTATTKIATLALP